MEYFNLSAMRVLLAIILISFSGLSARMSAQALQTINYQYRYNPLEIFSLNFTPVKQPEGFQVFYELQINDTARKKEDFTIQWETRKSTSEREGTAIASVPQILTASAYKTSGKISFTAEADQKIIVARVTITDPKKKWVFLFHEPLPQKETYFITVNQQVVINSFVPLNQPVALRGFDGTRPLIISHYSNPFPAAAPAFSTVQTKVSKILKPDTTFTTTLQPSFSFHNKGLYLIQQDTTSTEGVAFRVERDYPKLATLETLAGPLVYICSKQEYEKIIQAGNDKKKFDQVILSIVGNSERARTFMRGYFNRVEWANIYFSSYKEGWKTDRGMTFIIFGVPNEVYLFDDREVWEYKNENTNLRFQFVKSPTVFDPDNYVLIRDKKFTDDWYKVVDLLRKARF